MRDSSPFQDPETIPGWLRIQLKVSQVNSVRNPVRLKMISLHAGYATHNFILLKSSVHLIWKVSQQEKLRYLCLYKMWKSKNFKKVDAVDTLYDGHKRSSQVRDCR